MVIATLVLVALTVLASVLQFVLSPKPEIEDARPGALGDFDAPTATEKRSVPVVWGNVKVSGPNVTWYGDLANRAIRQTEGGQKFTIGFQYFLGLDMAICHGSDDIELYRIDVGDKEDVFQGTLMSGVNTYDIDRPNLFGGSKKGGGLTGTLEFYEGTNIGGAAETSQYLADELTSGDKNLMPAYVNLCHVVWEGPSAGFLPSGSQRGYLTTNTSIDLWTFYVRRFPLPADMTVDPGAEQIGDDANPVCVLFETLTNTVWGLDLPVSDLDIPAFNAAANTVAIEGIGFSLVWQTRRPTQELVNEVTRTIDAVIYQGTDGKITIELVREITPTLTLDESNVVKLRSFTRSAWNQTSNHVQIDFTDRDDSFKETSAAQQDLANFRLQEGTDAVSGQSYPGVKAAIVAQEIAARELKQLSFPLATIEIEANREASDLRPGDVFTFDWPELGISGMVVRVTTVDLGELSDGGVLLNGVEDVFGVGAAIFSAPPDSDWVPVLIEPTDLLVRDVLEVPQQLASVASGVVDGEFNGDTLDTDFRLMAIAEDPGNGFEFTSHDRIDGTSNPFLPWDPALFPDSAGAGEQYLGYTPTGELPAVLEGYAGGSEVLTSLTLTSISNDFLSAMELDDPLVAPFGVRTFTTQEVRDGKALILLGGDGTRQEYMGFEVLTDNGDGTVTLGTVSRGLLDTSPVGWPSGTKVWFVGEQYVLLTDIDTGVPTVTRSTRRIGFTQAPADVRDIRLAQLTSGGELTPEQATEINRTIATLPRQTRPGLVGDVRVRVATAAAGAGLPGAALNYTPDADPQVAGSVYNTISGVTGSFDLQVDLKPRDRVPNGPTEYWLPGDAADTPPAGPSQAYVGDPFVVLAAPGVAPARRATYSIDGIFGGVTNLASGSIDLSALASFQALALPANGVSNSDIIRITIDVERREGAGSTTYASEFSYFAIFQRVA